MGRNIAILGLAVALTAGSARGGTYASITLDGNFADWADVPTLVSDPEELDAGVDYAEIKVANDEHHIYVYMRLHRDANPFAYYPDDSNYFVDGDNNLSTGFAVFGGLAGSEVFIQGPDAYQQAGGGWNEGALAAGTVLQSPFGVSASQFEFSINRDVLGVAGAYTGLSLITGATVRFAFQGAPGSAIRDELLFSYNIANPPICIDVLPTTYKTITIDGDFGDWTNVPAAVADLLDPTAGVDYHIVRVANDADYVYVYFNLHTPANPFEYYPNDSNYFIDGDNNAGTGLTVFGGLAGSEFMIQAADAFQQAGGGFNEGSLPAGTVIQAPYGVAASEFEMRINRHVLGVAGAFTGLPLITASTIRIAFQGSDFPGDTGSKDEFVVTYHLIDSVCPGAIAPGGIDAQGRPLGDLNGDCKVNLADFAIFQLNMTGP